LISQLSPVFNYFQFVDPTNKGKQEDLAKRLKDADTLINKLEKAVDVSSKIAQKQEVVEYGNAFDEMANKTNAIRARRNIIAMYISLAVTLFIALIFVWGKHLDIPDESFSLKLIWNTILDQNILLKLFMVSAGGYLVAHFSRNYSAEMNMYYTNKHRQLALNSHQRIIDSVIKTETPNDAETKNAILLQVAKTMFDIQETGYLKNGNNPVPTTQIVETVRTGITRE